MEDVTRGRGFFDDEIALMHKGDTVYIVYPNQKDEEGNAKVVMIPKSLFVEFGMKFM
ncbi:hypothetical protein [Ammoniphilus oxalaticus]|uniref:hypothetical protein n=1 Tax=Ammoniphilus oxalaticus TaxID=66863 RepID=UPI0014746E1C|nr:hypothetical protein [Ammoniphilus oxalaticus]